MPRRPDFVYLDLGNVIVAFDRPRAHRQMAAVAGLTVQAVQAALSAGDLEPRLERGEIDWPAFHAEFSRLSGTNPAADRLAEAASDMFALNVAMLPVIAGLERAGIPIGILSNTCGIHWDHLVAKRYAVLPGNVVATVLSHEVGAVKPETTIYEAAAARAGVPPERIFFCDDIPAHVETARACGWDAEVFESAAGLIDALDRRGLNLGV
ncbi:HAD family phosphatase [bacterium]|nr:HAD family phosphatase [bacterium]